MSRIPESDFIESGTPQEQLDSVHSWLLQQGGTREEQGAKRLLLTQRALTAAVWLLAVLYIVGTVYALVRSRDAECAADLWRFTLGHLIVTCTAPVTFTALTLCLNALLRCKERVTPLVFALFIAHAVVLAALSSMYVYRLAADCAESGLRQSAYVHIALDVSAAVLAAGLVGGAMGMAWL